VGNASPGEIFAAVVFLQGSVVMRKQLGSHSAEPARPPPLRSAAEPPCSLDIVVLLSIAVFLVLDPPNLQYLSYLHSAQNRLSGDVLGGALTGLATLLLLAYFVVAMRGAVKWAAGIKLGIVLTLGVSVVVLPTVSDMLARHDVGLQVNGRTVARAHDGGVLQTEAAVAFLLQGVSPYSADYSETQMALGVDSRPQLWRSLGFEQNPALHFYPYPPFTILLSVPFCLGAHTALGWFDQRMVYLVAWGGLAVLGYRLPLSPRWKLPLMTLLVFNPIAALFFVPGRNDILCQTFLVATVLLLMRKHYRWASLLLGLSCGLKQFAWLLVPFYLAYASRGPTLRPHESPFKRLADRCWPLFASTGAILVPFAIWDPGGLVHGLIVAQGSVYPFRSSSLGFSNFLILFGAIDSFRAWFPLWVFAVLIVLPVFVCGVRRVLKVPRVSVMLTWYAVALSLLLFFGRHFAHNYLAVVFAVMALACVAAHDEARSTTEPRP